MIQISHECPLSLLEKSRDWKFIFLYKTTNLVNNKIYVGVHCTDNLEDGYIGCGIFCQQHATDKWLLHRAVRKYGYESFSREILEFFEKVELAFQREREIVNSLWVNSSSNYNVAEGGIGGNTLLGLSDKQREEIRKKRSQSLVKKWSNYSEEKKREIIEKITAKNKGRKGNRLGCTNSTLHRSRISASRKGNSKQGTTQTKEHIEKRKESMRKFDIKTPNGIFHYLDEVTISHGLCSDSIIKRLNSDKYPDWERIPIIKISKNDKDSL